MEERAELNNDSALELEIKTAEELNKVSERISHQSTATGTPAAEPQHEVDLTVKVPVVLAELTLQIDVDTNIVLPEPAIEIKRAQKRLKLTQCMLIQDANKLFVKGFVRKNIEYATVTSATPEQISGAIKFTTEDISFSAIVPISFDLAPIAPLNFNSVQNYEFLKTQPLPTNFPAKDTLESGDLTEFNQIGTEFFNEPPFCELVSSKIVEYDEFLNRTPLAGGPFEEMTFTQIEEKMVIFITLKILQRQQVVLSSEPLTGTDLQPGDRSAEDPGREDREEKKDAEKRRTYSVLPIKIDT